MHVMREDVAMFDMVMDGTGNQLIKIGQVPMALMDCLRKRCSSTSMDLVSSKLTFLINDKFQINAFDNILKSDDIKYRMLVALYDKDDCVEISAFSKQ